MNAEMNNFFSMLSSLFAFCETTEILGISLVTWFVIALVLSAVGIFVKGNK